MPSENLSKTKKIISENWNPVITVLATVAIAWATVQSWKVQEEGVKVSHQLADLQDLAVRQEKVRLQAELRPYVVPQLVADNLNLFRDGNSRLFLNLYEGKFLVVPIIFTNVGKIPALNIKATYDSPTRPNVSFDLGDNVVLPEAQPTALYRPWVNISNEVERDEKKEFNIFLKINYKGIDDVDSRVCHSLLKLVIRKKENGIYEIVDKDFNFGFEK